MNKREVAGSSPAWSIPFMFLPLPFWLSLPRRRPWRLRAWQHGNNSSTILWGRWVVRNPTPPKVGGEALCRLKLPDAATLCVGRVLTTLLTQRSPDICIREERVRAGWSRDPTRSRTSVCLAARPSSARCVLSFLLPLPPWFDLLFYHHYYYGK